MVIKLIERVVKRLVDKPDLVVVREVPTEEKLVLHILVAPHDLSRVIGSEGRVFRALKALVFVNSDQYRDIIVDSVQE